MKRLPLVASFILFVAVCASLAYWGMQLFVPPARPMAAPPQNTPQEVQLPAVASLLGGTLTPAAAVTNYQLKGIVMSGTPGESIAILAAEGKPVQTARVSKELAPGVVVKEVHPTYVLLSEGGVPKRIALPDNARGLSMSGDAAPPPQALPPEMQQQGGMQPQMPPQQMPAPQAGMGGAPMKGDVQQGTPMTVGPNGQPVYQAAPGGEMQPGPAQNGAPQMPQGMQR